MAAKGVWIKDMGIDMQIKNKGLELDIRDGGTHLGDLYITKTGLVWCKGKVTKANGISLSWEKFCELAEKSA